MLLGGSDDVMLKEKCQGSIGGKAGKHRRAFMLEEVSGRR